MVFRRFVRERGEAYRGEPGRNQTGALVSNQDGITEGKKH